MSSAPSRARGAATRAAAGLAIVATLAAPASAAPRRSPLDQAEVDAMKAASPRAFALLTEGEERATAGRLEDADALFRQALEVYKSGTLLLRRRCEALTALGRRTDAVASCYRALEGARSNANVRAAVRAFVAGPAAPSLSDAGMALDLAAKARDRAPGQLTPTAALCDIGAALGDGIMLHRCAQALERIAPGAPEIAGARARLAAGNPPWRRWAGWAVTFLAVLATLGHAIARSARRRRGLRPALVAGALAAVLGAAPGAARAAEQPPQTGMLSKWPVSDDAPEASIPSEKDRNADPLEFGYWLQDVILRAEVYSKHGKHDVAVRLYKALAIAVPGRAIAFAKMCEEYEAMGDLAKAAASCEGALLRDGLTVENYERYVRLTLAKPGPLTERETKALGLVLAHMNEDPAGRVAAEELACDVGVRTSDAKVLESCVNRRAAAASDDARTLGYRWALAMMQGRLDDARTLAGAARAAGLPAARVDGMQLAMSEATRRQRVRALLIAVGVIAIGAAAAAIARLRSPRRPALA